MILPSKKVLSVFILIIALVGATIIAFGKDKSGSAINYASSLVAGEKISIPENPDWQNELNKIAQSVEPNKTGPALNGKENATDLISRSLMANYLSLKQNGTLTQESANQLINQTVNLFDQLGDKVILATKLNTIPDNGRQSVEDYGENLGRILKNDRPKKIIDEREIINTAVSTEDSSKIEELDSVIAIYEKISSDLLKMPVPQTFVKAHLDMTNGAIAMATALKDMKIVLDDPFMGLSALQLYQEGANLFIQARTASVNFILKNNIIYKQGTGGYYLLYGI